MKKWNSAFASLAISYVALVLVLVLILCSIFSTYFAHQYKKELQSKNQLILENTAQTIETRVLQRVQQIDWGLAVSHNSDLRLFADAALNANPVSLLNLQEAIKSEAAGSSDIVQAVHIYNPDQNVMLSSRYGLLTQAVHGDHNPFFADWIEKIRGVPHASLWTGSRQVADDVFSAAPGGSSQALVTYAHSYPFPSHGKNNDLIIAVDVRESAITGIIQNMMPFQSESTFLFDRSAGIIKGSSVQSGGTALQVDYSSNITKIWSLRAESGSFEENADSGSSVVSYRLLPTTGWMICSIVPADLLYEESIVLQRVILGVCLFALLLGIGMSGILAKVSYSPIRRLVHKIRDLTGHSPDPMTNEYRIIDTAFISLSDKLSSMEENLQSSSSMMKRHVMLNMLQGGYTREELAEELRVLGISQEHTYYCCLLLDMTARHAALPSDHGQNIQQLTSRLQSVCCPDSRIMVEELPDHRLAIILGTYEAADAQLERLSDFLLGDGELPHAGCPLSWGCWVKEMSDIHLSCHEARTLLKYAYFLPEQTVLKDRSLLERENNAEEIPPTILSKFREQLSARHPLETLMVVDQLITTLREGPYPADYCHFVLANTVFVYSDYLKSIRYQHPAGANLDLYHQYLAISHVHMFRDWLADSIATFMNQAEKRNSDRALSAIESAKQYIENHLPEDLSLEMVSSKVFISSKYLSRLFKEELGVTYTDYVTSRRMERARMLIENNTMTIEQIAGMVGYGTPAYFIKRFKDRYGCTPGHYMRNSLKHG
ncbi:AraC family transcriptional regulator [Paenibacillus sp. JX-17]|uniref:AraC family transcriptional regulator n=1 Tax=Paenibacillus lacisoli TaxID=3064525 RepID=A0ABT9CFN4_9BACL|nr:AraC family transcriptional regulator [Paenibacillus sp. JX-17]MDO7907690.1 AraC family transcriptional regulator [Paenibacillus sp. JX-17]